MNTDNMSISGETIDYGPCAFLEAYDPDKVFSSIDHNGRYAYSNQPHAAHWNLTRLAECLLPLLEMEQAQEQEAGAAEAGLAAAHAALASFAEHFDAARLAGLRRKLGLTTEQTGDAALAEDLLERMAANHADFTLTFRRLADAAESADDRPVSQLFSDPATFDAWAAAWRQRLAEEPVTPSVRAATMREVNPAFIPRNHLVQAVIDAAVTQQDLAPFEDLLHTVTHPWDDDPARARHATPARPEECVRQTFCGT